MGWFGGIEDSQSGGGEVRARYGPAHAERRRATRSDQLAVGTLACRCCDAPISTGRESLRMTDRLTCPFCQHHAPVRDFLSLTQPTRPVRVVVRVGFRR